METHILQTTGLAELTTTSSLFGENTVLSLTDKGKELFFEEDAELFIEQGDDKCRIRYGESEKIIKKIFSDYRKACRGSEKKPILLFNEADAIFSKRRSIGSGGGSIDQTENTIQNIILEEMEKPSLQAKTNIWCDKLSSLSEDEARRLASGFDFSGGEIDNIVRKATMEEVISGNPPSIRSIFSLCEHERLSGGVKTRIGF